MEQVFEFIGNHPVMISAFVLLLVLLVFTEIGRLRRGFAEVSPLQAVQLINRDEAAVIDVSANADFHKGHIVGAVHVPISQIHSNNNELIKLKGRPLLVCCKNGATSTQAAVKLLQLGFAPVHVLQGGLTQWEADKQPVTRGR